MLPILAQGIDSVPADFIKNLLTVILAVAAAWFAYVRGKRVAGTKAEPVHMAQPVGVTVETEVKVRPAVEWASKDEVKELKQQLKEVGDAGAERRLEIVGTIHDSEMRTQGTIVQEMRALHERLNPVAEGVKAHEAVLEQIQDRLSGMERTRHDEVARINQRIDDAIRAASQRGSKA